MFQFPAKSEEKLRLDIVPTPNEDIFVVLGPNIYPLLDVLDGVLESITKTENVGGSGFDGHALATNNINKAVAIMEDWGWKPTLYDEVATAD